MYTTAGKLADLKNRYHEAVTASGEAAIAKQHKKGKKTASARTEFLSCSVQLSVSSDYVIRSIKVLGDVKKSSGPSWCEEFLVGQKAS